MAKGSLTKLVVERIAPQIGRDVFAWDTKVPGFGVRVAPSGRRSYVYQYRTRDGKQRRVALGIHGALTVEQARGRARDLYEKVRGGSDPAKTVKPVAEPITLGAALDRYEADLRTRGGDTGNVSRVRAHLTAALGGIFVADLTPLDLRPWRDGLAKSLAPATINRTTTALKAALNHIADQDARISNRRGWEIGLATILGAEDSRNVILADDVVRRLIAEAHNLSPQFGSLVEVAAVTGARVSQIARLECQDLQGGQSPRLMMPASAKGKGAKAVLRRPVPIGAGLASRLQAASAGRPGTAPLLTKPTGRAWCKSDHARPFKRAAVRCGLDPGEVTIYALRHSSIARQIKANVPIRVVAVNHDTSVAMIERNYSRDIADFTDQIGRGALLDVGGEARGEAVVVPLRAGRQ